MIDTTEIWLQERSREEALAERQLQRTPALLPPKPTILSHVPECPASVSLPMLLFEHRRPTSPSLGRNHTQTFRLISNVTISMKTLTSSSSYNHTHPLNSKLMFLSV